MSEFPDFIKRDPNRIDSSQQNTPDIDGYYYEAPDGSQVCLWTYLANRVSKENVHDFDEYVLCVDGEYVEIFNGEEHILHRGDELTVPKGTPHHGRVTAGTRTIHIFGGRRIVSDTSGVVIVKAEEADLETVLKLQYLAYQSEAELFGSKDIPPLKQTLEEVCNEYKEGIILKLVDKGVIIGSVRAKETDGTVYIGKLMVHPDFRRRGYGKMLLAKIESFFPGKRYELFTSTRSKDNIHLYQSVGYREFDSRAVDDELTFIYMEKT